VRCRNQYQEAAICADRSQQRLHEVAVMPGVEWRWLLLSEVSRLGCRIFQQNRRSSSHPTENGNFANNRRAAFDAFPYLRLRYIRGARGVDGCLEDLRRRAVSDGSVLAETRRDRQERGKCRPPHWRRPA